MPTEQQLRDAVTTTAEAYMEAVRVLRSAQMDVELSEKEAGDAERALHQYQAHQPADPFDFVPEAGQVYR